MTKPEILAIAQPINFAAQMARKTHDGGKTLTARVMKPQPGMCEKCGCNMFVELLDLVAGGQEYACLCTNEFCGNAFAAPQPKYTVGDLLYVREPWERWSGTCTCEDEEFLLDCGPEDCDRCKHKGPAKIVYEADCINPHPNTKFREPDTMWPELARTFLRVTAVRAERLQDSIMRYVCSALVLQEEGMDIGDDCRQCIEDNGEPCCRGEIDRDGSRLAACEKLGELLFRFAHLWDTLYYKEGKLSYMFQSNPWCWIYEFERVMPDG